MSNRVSRFLGRSRKFSYEDWQNLYNANADETKPLTFVSELVSGEYTNLNIWQHLLKVAREDPLAYRMTVGLAKNVFDDWFTIKKMGEDGELEEHPKNKQIQEEFTAMNAQFWFTQAAIGMYIFGSSALVFNYNKHREDYGEGEGGQIATLDVFTKENMIIPHDAYDEVTGEPTHIKIYPNATNEAVTDEIPWEELQWWCDDPIGRSYDGYSVMTQVWANLVYFRESNDAMVWAHKKVGIGVQMWRIKGGMSPELKDSIEESIQDISGRRAFVVEADKVEDVGWTAPPASGTDAIVAGLEFALGIIASGSEIPKDVYTGVSAGAITGSEINNKALYATIDKKQSAKTPKVLDSITRMGYDNSDMVIDWNVRYATDTLEQAQERYLNAQAALLEMQVEQGGDSLSQFAQTFGPDNKDQSQNQNPAGVQS